MNNRQVILTQRPNGIPNAEHFAIVDAPMGVPDANEILIKNQYLSVDPAMRGWVSAESNYAAPVPIGGVMRASAVGRVLESNSSKFQPGDTVFGRFGWQEFAVVDSGVARKVHPEVPASLSLGVMGSAGVTAWVGLIDIARPRPGDLVVVSTAAGAVGSIVGQLAKLAGATTVGITGSEEKVDICRREYGYDVALNYRAVNFLEELSTACAAGVDVYFDNTSGAISDAVMTHLAHQARIVICGTASVDTWLPVPSGPRVHRQILTNAASMHGVLVQDNMHRMDEVLDRLAPLINSGAVRYREHILSGLESAPGSIEMLYRGENLGKTMIRLE